jgi:acyl-CoA synthetase (AMP-forming)/AMP-acid ligase II
MNGSALSAAAWSRRIAQRFPDHDAIIDGARRVTYAQLDRRVERLAVALAGRGVVVGDRIAALLVNGLPLVELYLAAARLGAILLPLNWRLAGPELGWIIDNAEPRILFASDNLVALAAVATHHVPTIIVAEQPNTEPGTQDDYGALIAATSEDAHLSDDPAPELPWIMLYTSGTTGRPKGCLLSQQGQVIAALAMASQWQSDEHTRLLLSLPLFHVGGTGLLFAHLTVGATIIIAPRQFNAEAARRMAAELRCTALGVVPQFYPDMIAAQKSDPLPLTLRLVTMGGGMHPPELVAEVRDVLGAEPILGYGQTEAGNYIAYIKGAEQLRHPKACGRALPQFDVRVVDADDNPLPIGAVGELCVRGPSVLDAYWRNPEATEIVLRGGWLHTGDLIQLDKQGLITMMGRSKELIKTGGENVYPKEVEAVLFEHPAIADCVVFGVPHDYWGEAVKVMIARHPGQSLDARGVVDWVRARIAGYKRPRYVEFVDALPRTDTGKLLTRELQARPLTADQAVD